MTPPIRWPRGFQSAVAMTFDLDAETAWISRDAANRHRPSVLSQGAYGPKVGVPLILDFLDRNDLKVTFFIPGWTAERWPDVVAEIHRRGHEIGNHGYLHEGVEGCSRDEQAEILAKGSRILAGITGKSPVGYRAPLYEVTYDTPGILREHGFRYASNLQDTLWPYLHPGSPPLVELPTSWIMDDGPYFAYGIRPPLYRQIYPPSAVFEVWREEFLGIHALGGLFTLILHPQYIGRPSRVALLQRVLDMMRATGRVWLAKGLEIAEHVARTAVGASSDGRPGPGRPAARRPRPSRSRTVGSSRARG
jgi:peptidoglycan/xylan/chitin deacetylase (PgdA/CDA1 family)